MNIFSDKGVRGKKFRSHWLMVLSRFATMREGKARGWRKIRNDELHSKHSTTNIWMAK
jgi:hypothetical protein